MKNKLLYFGLLVVTLYLAILYDSPMLLGFGLMEMIHAGYIWHSDVMDSGTYEGTNLSPYRSCQKRAAG